ncbi:unnamed protein product [Ilex paraguariensis]|uniref:RNase H type-1 domain-containing protein n=1 Tax=Ilex paraguariensis TaxID=185542 RepID=A0ABC8QPK1_9AQUA
MGVGVVARDCNGDFVAGLGKLVCNPLSEKHVEAMAAFTGIKLVMELGFNKVILEEDSTNNIEAIHLRGSNLSNVEIFVDQVHIQANRLTDFSAKWIRRQENFVANALTKYTDICKEFKSLRLGCLIIMTWLDREGVRGGGMG